MSTTTTRLVRDGNSVAVRLPKHVLRESGLCGTLTLEASEGQITLKAASGARADWAERIQAVQASDSRTGDTDAELALWEAMSTEYDDETG